jgi:hypothetical protein
VQRPLSVTWIWSLLVFRQRESSGQYYKKELDVYHGALEHKESYAKAFFAQTPETVADGSYEVEKLYAVLDAIVAEASLMATYIPQAEE